MACMIHEKIIPIKIPNNIVFTLLFIAIPSFLYYGYNTLNFCKLKNAYNRAPYSASSIVLFTENVFDITRNDRIVGENISFFSFSIIIEREFTFDF